MKVKKNLLRLPTSTYKKSMLSTSTAFKNYPPPKTMTSLLTKGLTGWHTQRVQCTHATPAGETLHKSARKRRSHKPWLNYDQVHTTPQPVFCLQWRTTQTEEEGNLHLILSPSKFCQLPSASIEHTYQAAGPAARGFLMHSASSSPTLTTSISQPLKEP